MMATSKSHTSEHTKARRIKKEFYYIQFKDNVHNTSYKIPAEVAHKLKQQLTGYEVEEIPLSKEDAFYGLHGNASPKSINLKGLRAREGLTQMQMAEKLSITQGNLSAYETGKRPIGKNMAKKIADIFKINYQLFL